MIRVQAETYFDCYHEHPHLARVEASKDGNVSASFDATDGSGVYLTFSPAAAEKVGRKLIDAAKKAKELKSAGDGGIIE